MEYLIAGIIAHINCFKVGWVIPVITCYLAHHLVLFSIFDKITKLAIT